MSDRPKSRGDWFAPAAAAAAALVLAPSLIRAAAPLDEGMLVAYPDFVLRGLVPGLDFNWQYGPAGLWPLAALFRLIGPSLVAERAVGLVYRAAILAAVWFLARRRSAAAAFVAVTTGALILVPVGSPAVAWLGAIACILWALEITGRAVARSGSRSAGLATLAGLLGGTAILYRPDLCLAAAGTCLPLIAMRGDDRRRRALCFSGGVVVALLPLAAHAARIGVHRLMLSLVVEPRLTMAGRWLPLPPRQTEVLGFFLLTLAGAAFLLGCGLKRVWHQRDSVEPRLELALGLLSVLLLPQLLHRADGWHIAYVAVVSVALLPFALLPFALAAPRRRRGLAWAPLVGVIGLCPHLIGQRLLDDAKLLVERGGRGAPSIVARRGRSFLLDDAVHATEVRSMLAALDRVARPGQRLFVGPEDLRRTNYGDTFLYYLLPELRPASTFTAMDPGRATQPDSPLADQIATADWLLLTSRYDGWDEPNASRAPGSTRPLSVVRRHFCLLARSGTYSLLGRCAPKTARTASR